MLGVADPHGAPGAPLRGCRVLLVEDEAIVAMVTEDLMAELGCDAIKHVASVADALAAMSAGEFDVAVLDVNLKGETSFGIADALAERVIPFMFCTGYGRAGLPDRYRQRVCVRKPFSIAELAAGLEAALERGDP